MVWHWLVFGIVQGVAEFIPVSSSAHLVILRLLMQWQTQGLVIDIAAHVGTLVAALFFFRKEVIGILQDIGLFFSSGQVATLAFRVALACVPAFCAGYFIKPFLRGEGVRSILVIGIASIIFGLLMGIVDRQSACARTDDQMTLKEAFYIGCIQMFALIPGASRMGTTMTMARYLGFSRSEAMRFSLLVSIPITLAAAMLTFVDAFKEGVDIFQSAFCIVALVSGGVGYGILHVMMKWIPKVTLMPFAVYRVLLGLVLLGIYACGLSIMP